MEPDSGTEVTSPEKKKHIFFPSELGTFKHVPMLGTIFVIICIKDLPLRIHSVS